MTVPVQETINRIRGNGVTTVFPYSFFLLAASDLSVMVDGVPVVLGITVSGVGALQGGDVTFATPPANSALVVLERKVKLERATDYQQNGDFLSPTVNKDFDRLWMAIQQHQSSIDKSVKFSAADEPLTTELPSAASRANKALVFDAAGNAKASVDDFVNQIAITTANAQTTIDKAAIATEQALIATAKATSATNSENSATLSASQALAAAQSGIGFTAGTAYDFGSVADPLVLFPTDFGVLA